MRLVVCFYGSVLFISSHSCSEDNIQPNVLGNLLRDSIYNTGQKLFCALLGLCASAIVPSFSLKPGLNTVFQWRQLEFDYPDRKTRECDIEEGRFDPSSSAPIDVDVYYSDNSKHSKVFVTIPRFQEGVPATFGVVTDKKSNGNPIIQPYPSWEWHTNSEQCKQNRLVSVFRVQIDECDRLWVIDTGKIAETQLCPPQIIAFDLRTNEVIHQFDIPSNLYEDKSLQVTIIADVRKRSSSCEDTFIYVADCQSFVILVYDVQNRRAWKVKDKTMYPDPAFGTYDILGDQWELMDGVLGLAISPYQERQDRRLYYHAMSSGTEHWVSTTNLRNHSLWKTGMESWPQLFHTFNHKRDSQVAAETIDKEGIMYFGLHKEVNIVCWNTRTDYNMQNFDVIDDDQRKLQFESGIKIIKTRKGVQELWALTSRFNKVATSKLNTNETNFRILAGKTSDLLFGSKCKNPKGSSGGISSGGGYGFVRQN